MFADIDLAKLSDISAQERACLSLYLASPTSVEKLDKRIKRVQCALKRDGGDKSEREHFDENVKVMKKYLLQHPLESGSMAIFSCWALDVFEVFPLTAPVDDLLWVDSSPYIRPLAELQDEYEDVAVVVADNKKTRIFLVSSAKAGSESVVSGNVKNHVKKGGWSQQRYERRRDKQLLLYAREIAQALKALDETASFRGILLVGGKEILRILFDNLPRPLQNKVHKKAIDLSKGEGVVNRDIMDLFQTQERQSEQALWEHIRTEYLRGGLGLIGLEDVLRAAKAGQIDTLIVDRHFKPAGKRCRDCDGLYPDAPETCVQCQSASLFDVDMVNELVELVKQSGGEIDFTDAIGTLTQAGHIAALLRYK